MFSIIRHLMMTTIAIWAMLELSVALIPAAIAATAYVMHKRGENYRVEKPRREVLARLN